MAKPDHPYLESNWLSKLTFWWMNSLFYKGYKHGLESDDLYTVLPFHSSEYMGDKVERIYNSKYKGRKRGLVWALITAFTKKIIIALFLLIMQEGLIIVQPVLVAELVSYFQGQSSKTDTTAYISAVLLALTGILMWIPITHFFYINQLMGARMRTACSTLMYKKFFRLSQSSVSRISTGRIVNLLSTDLDKFNMGTMFYHYIWMSPLEMVIVLYLLYNEVGLAFLSGLAFFILLLPYQLGLAKTFNSLRYKIASQTDRRIHVMNEIIGAMRVIKMYCWEKPFGNLVAKLRGSEMKYIWRNSNIKGQNEVISFISPTIATFLIIVTYYLMGGEITASLVVKIIGWAELLKSSIVWMLYMAVQTTTSLIASIDRIQTFLETEELDAGTKSITQKTNEEKTELSLAISLQSKNDSNNQVVHDNVMAINGINKYEKKVDLDNMAINDINEYEKKIYLDNSDTVIELKGVSATWDSSSDATNGKPYTLKDIEFSVTQGELVAVIGNVGSGKSSLLMALLGELPPSKGTSRLSGQVAYVPQESWVVSGTVRDNILFGEKYKTERYEQTIKTCSLKTDFQLMENQDFTLIGERGYSLSGGQKARINLARAAYREADVYLMDDPLSAVDTKVARHLFENCICGQMEKKTRVLVTHQVQFLRRADRILVMQDGSITANGSYEEVSKFIDIASVIATEKEKEGESHLTRDNTRTSSRVVRRRTHSQRSNLSGDDIDLEILDDANEYRPVIEEDRTHGNVSFKVYSQYFKAGRGVLLFPIFVIMTVASQASINLCDWILAEWDQRSNTDMSFHMYIGFFCGVIVISTTRSIVFFAMTTFSSKNLHNKMFRTLLRAPISFFDKNPVGRILNRFSRDMGLMDDMLPEAMHQVTMYIGSFFGTVIFISIANYWTLLLTLPIMLVIIFVRQVALKTMREVKRIEATLRSPVYSHISSTLMGLPVIRAFKVEDSFIRNFYHHQDNQISPWMLYLDAQQWFGIRLDWCIGVYLVGYLIAAFAVPGNGSAGGMIGISLSYIMGLLGFLQYIIKQTAEAESYMTSVERILEYTEISSEAEEHNDSYRPPKDWPTQGNIQFDNMCLAYGENSSPVLKNINIKIASGEKIGIVGRTGAGKSSLISCLMRLNEPTGNIIIDDLQATKLGLAHLRGAVSIIPQDPVLFSGTLRYNLDPLTEYSDDVLWNALSQVQLSEKVRSMEGGLYGEMSEAGGNLSVGQRQLVCLARAILRNKKILLIDEATANVDPMTDELIQKTLRENFVNCTVLTIAHRLHTIIDSDKVLVLDQGNVVEFDHAHILLQLQGGHFHQMVLQTGRQTEQRLHSLAKAAYINKVENLTQQPSNCIEQKSNMTNEPADKGSVANTTATTNEDITVNLQEAVNQAFETDTEVAHL